MNELNWLDITLRTLGIAAAGTVMITPPGIVLGYLLARSRFRGKAIVQTLVALPMVLPPVAVGLALLLLLSPNYAPGRFLLDTLGWRIVFTWQAAALAAGAVSFPLLVRVCEQAFAEVPVRLEKVAASLGASRWKVFREVSLPLARRGVVYGMILAFTRGLGEFGATNLVAGSIPGVTQTLSLGIYQEVILGRDRNALILAGVSIVLAFAAMVVAELYLKPRTRIETA